MKQQKYDEITTYLSVIQGQIYEKINLYVFRDLLGKMTFSTQGAGSDTR